MAIDAVGDVWAELAVVRESSDRDFHFFRYVVNLEKQAKGGREVLTGVWSADEDFVACSKVWDVVDPNVPAEFFEMMTVVHFDGRGSG